MAFRKIQLALCFCILVVMPSALSLSCRSGYHPCKDGIFCIPKSWLCDNEDDCFDGSDEADCNKCGIRKMDSATSSLIIGGTRAGNGEFPWHVGVWINGKYECGGVFMARGLVLTTASCVLYESSGVFKAFRSQVIKVHLGSTKLTYYDSRRVKASVCAVYVGDLGDFAVLKLCSNVPYSYTIHPICLPSDNCGHYEDNDETCYATGWGWTSRYSSVNPQYLQKTRAWIQPMSKCVAAGYTGMVSGKQLCVQTSGRNCYDDFGGPVTCRNRRGQWLVRGFFSIMKRGCTSYYSIYTSVCAYRKAIIDLII